MSYIDLNHIRVSYDNKQDVLNNFGLAIEEGELVSLLGPSGCGKTTTLRVIAGLIQPNDGTFIVDHEDLTKVPVHKRNFGMVFQSYALFPHLTIKENVAFGLKLRKVSKKEIDKRVARMLEICGLSDLGDRYPKQLSGGQRQRVALARALIIEPKLLLLDEPLSNLDAKLRVSMRVEIKRIQQELGITTVFVTHDQEECFSISDKVAIMNEGVIEQFDTPETIYNYPRTEFVARFIGFENFISVTNVTYDAARKTQQATAKDGTVLEASTIPEKNAENGSKIVEKQSVTASGGHSTCVATIRPDDIEVTSDGPIKGTVSVRTFLGKAYQYAVETPLGELIVTTDDTVAYQPGQNICITLPSHKLIILER